MAQFIKIARSARKNGVSRARILAAMRHAPAPEAVDGGSVLFVGRDSGGKLLEVLARGAREGENALLVYHAMPVAWRSPKGRR